MKVETHVKIAELAFRNNIKVVPKGFSKFMFNFGLVMIDQSWHVITHPHYKEKSLAYVLEKIEKLLSVRKFNAYYSMQLGIVVHYLCDFCCNAHILGSVGNIPYHLKYERGLQKYILDNYDILREHFNKPLNDKSHSLNSLNSIKASLVNVLDNYMKSDASYLLDIKKCVEITSMVCSNVFDFNVNLSRNIAFEARQFQIGINKTI
ncbi:zinc dependent phospholipase C family protein [Clostridium sp.]